MIIYFNYIEETIYKLIRVYEFYFFKGKRISPFFAPGTALFVAACIALIPWSEILIFYTKNIPPDQMKSALSSTIAFLGSSMAWLRSSYNDRDKNANFTAAGLSGVGAIFAIPAISIPKKLEETGPEFVQGIINFGYSAGWIVLILVIAQSIWRYISIRPEDEMTVAEVRAIAALVLVDKLAESLIERRLMTCDQAREVVRAAENDRAVLSSSNPQIIQRIIRNIGLSWGRDN